MSPASRASNRLRELYRVVFVRMRALNARLFDPAHAVLTDNACRVESLEARLMLNGQSVLTDFALFGSAGTALHQGVRVSEGLIGSYDSVEIQKDVETRGILGGGDLHAAKSLAVDGDILFSGRGSLGKGAVVNGNIDGGERIVVSAGVKMQ